MALFWKREVTGLVSLTLAGVLLITFVPLAAPEDRSALLEQIDAIVEETMARDQIVGTSVGVHRRGEVLLAKGYGYADLENQVRATEHTVFRIGSITKQFTAAAILILEERDRLRLSDPLTEFLPDYETTGHHISVERLLNHTSGIKGYTEMGEKFWGKSRLDLSHEEMVELFSAEPFQFAPGEEYSYNNSAYYLLGLIIEKVSGKSYADFLQENLWTPLGMRESHYLYNDPIVPNRAEGYEVQDGEVVNDAPLSMRLPFSAGSLGSSVMDLITWQHALSNERLLSGESYSKMTTPGTLTSGKKLDYGFGLSVGELSGRRKISHGGGINGFRTQLAYYPEDALTVVVLCNTGAAQPSPLESRIARAVLGIPETPVEEVTLGEDELRKYAGNYNPARAPFEVRLVDGALTLFGSRLRPVGNHLFFPVSDDYQKITFELSGDQVVALRMEREGQTMEAPRVP